MFCARVIEHHSRKDDPNESWTGPAGSQQLIANRPEGEHHSASSNQAVDAHHLVIAELAAAPTCQPPEDERTAAPNAAATSFDNALDRLAYVEGQCESLSVGGAAGTNTGLGCTFSARQLD